MTSSYLRQVITSVVLLSLLVPGLARALTPDDIVNATTREVLTQIERDRERLQSDPGYIKVIVRNLIVPHMDFTTMASLILGKDWSILNDAKQRCFTSSIRNLLVERYSHILLSYHDQDIHYTPTRLIGDQGYVSVLQTLTHGDSKPLTIGYPMRPDGDNWSVVDLVVDDVSLVRSYRLTFEKEIQRLGLADFLNSFQECKN